MGFLNKAGTYHGTVASKVRPVVTLLTDALVKDFCLAYRRGPDGLWVRTDEDGNEVLVNDAMLQADVRNWLLNLEQEMTDSESDRQFAKLCTQMIRKNKGWVPLLANRVKKRLSQ